MGPPLGQPRPGLRWPSAGGVGLAAAVLLAVQLTTAYNNGMGATPPMGWNTWCTDDACGLRDICTEAEIRSIADAMVDQGLDKLGYKYINMDDCWSDTSRNATGHLQPNAKQFPNGLKPLADYIHSKGLYFGLYTCIGTLTCKRGRPGSFGHYELDAQTLAEWGMDFIKARHALWIDLPSNHSEQELYTNFSKAINATGRPILFSLCEWGVDEPEEWAGSIAQMYRVQMDHIPFWHFPGDAAGKGFGQGTYDIIEYMATLDLVAAVRPYAWTDPDFLETLFPLTMSFVDSRTEFTFWSLWSAPLLVATDIRNLGKDKAEILTNPEVIAIDQDALAHGSARLFNHSDGSQLWAKSLANGDTAVVFYNSGNHGNLDIELDFSLIHAANKTLVVRDLWGRADVGNFTGSYKATGVRPHDVHFVRLRA